MIHFDTSYLIRALITDSPEDSQLRLWVATDEQLAISTIAWTEFLCGPISAEHVELTALVLPGRVPFSEDDARLSAELFNGTGRRRGSLPDCMIAASAIRCKAALATLNQTDFRRFEKYGLMLR